MHRMQASARVYIIIACMAIAAAVPGSAAEVASWQERHVKVEPTGDLTWAPRPFVYEAGDSVRYIDFEGGDDAAAGTRAAPWKRHPWDPAAKGKAAACEGIHTYVFKRGVVYRGRLVADDSGEPGNPIRLTSDPNWGKGEAAFYGSERITGGWKRCDAASAPKVPEPGKVWYKDVDPGRQPRALWELRDGRIVRIPLARTPNWTPSNSDDVHSEWNEWTDGSQELLKDGEEQARVVWGHDTVHLTETDPDYYVGATVWTEYRLLMGSPYATAVRAFDPKKRALQFDPTWGPNSSEKPLTRYIVEKYNRYFLENKPQYLDSAGEFYFAADGAQKGRLYLRLPGDRDPNTAVLELARELSFIRITSQNHIAITGLTFRFENVWNWHERWFADDEAAPAVVQVVGTCKDLRVSNCRFEHVAKVMRTKAPEPNDLLDDIRISDNEIRHTDHSALELGDGSAYNLKEAPIGSLFRVQVLRNKLYDIGSRPLRGEHSHALRMRYGQLVEVAGNIMDRTYGSGIFVFSGKGADLRRRPLVRTLIHHNKVTNTLLHTNDWGGIEAWQTGPIYMYNNVSGNPGGYWHYMHRLGQDSGKRAYNSSRDGFALYFDGAYKAYLFNNIAWGRNNDVADPRCNTAGFLEVHGFLNAAFNNTFYKFAVGIRHQRGVVQRGFIGGNLMMDISDHFFHRSAPTENVEFGTMAYTSNVFQGAAKLFATASQEKIATIEDFRKHLRDGKALSQGAGERVQAVSAVNPEAHDFRLKAGAPALNKGVRYFVPWGLYAVVGEWNFYKHPADPQTIIGESFNVTDEHVTRHEYPHVPRMNLKGVNIGLKDFVRGELEDWTEGALKLNGRDQYCTIRDADMKSDYTYPRGRGGETVTYPGSKRRTLDMGTNNFLIEVVFRTEPGKGGTLVSKMGDGGYYLEVLPNGMISLQLRATDGNGSALSVGTEIGGDGKWHHVIAEVDRVGRRLRVHLDGKKQGDGPMTLKPDASLSNTADFMVGRGADGSFFTGELDFLRVSRGTLADARTSIGELYDWQFNGPALKDFVGNAPTDGRRDAGAMERVAD
jgi:concanavalin A-like lectin/glucanase superfamily protein